MRCYECVGATQALSSAAGAVNIVSRDMETGRVLAMQDNQVRQHHRDAIDNLRSAQKVGVIRGPCHLYAI